MRELVAPKPISAMETKRLRHSVNRLKHLAILAAGKNGTKLASRWVETDTERPPKRCDQTGVYYGWGADVCRCPFCEEEYRRDEATDEVFACEHYDSEIIGSVLFVGPEEELI